MAKRENTKSNKNTKKKSKLSSFAWACWLLVLIIILLVFIGKKDTILTNLQNTSFFDRVFGSTPQFVEKHEGKEKKSKNKQENIKEKSEDELVLEVPSKKQKQKSISMNDLKKNLSKTPEQSEKIEEIKAYNNQNDDSEIEHEAFENKTELKSNQKKENSQIIEKDSVIKEDAENISSEEKKSVESKKEEKTDNQLETAKKSVETVTIQEKKTDVALWFVLIDSEGRVSRKEIKRAITKNDSPLTNAINLLLQGPEVFNSSEKDCLSLIPEGTRLISAKVSDGVAYLNFNDAFEFNTYGVEGYKHQLEQIVFTATSFSTVKSVQFLIEGEKEDYLGSEGMWIGSPLGRSSF